MAANQSFINTEGTVQRYTGRRTVGPQGANVPNLGGLASRSAEFTRYLNSLSDMIGATKSFADTYYGIVNERKEREVSTDISQRMRESFKELLLGEEFKGKGADNIMPSWIARQEKIRADIQKEYDDVPNKIINQVFARYGEQYQNRAGTLQVERQADWDLQSRTVATQEAAATAAMSQLGNWGAWDEAFAAAEKNFPNDPVRQMKAKDDASRMIIEAWGRQNPSQFLAWAQANEAEVYKKYGGSNVGPLKQMMQQAKNQVRSDISFSMSLQSFQQRQADRAQKQQQEDAKLQFFSRIAAGEAKPGDLLAESTYTDATGKVLSWAQALGSDGMSNVLSFMKQFDSSKLNGGFEERQTKYNELLLAADTTADLSVIQAQAAESLTSGFITQEQYKDVVKRASDSADLIGKLPGGQEAMKYNLAFAQDLIAPKSDMGFSKAQNAAQYSEFAIGYRDMITKLLKAGRSPMDVLKDMNVTDPNSMGYALLNNFLKNRNREFSLQLKGADTISLTQGWRFGSGTLLPGSAPSGPTKSLGDIFSGGK